MSRERWPRWVYGQGQEPDYRFSFANERTFLAWIRTSLALLAAGVAVEAIELSLAPPLKLAISVVLLVLGVLCAIASWVRWARAERAMRLGTFLPSSALGALLTFALVLVAVVLLVALR